MLLELIICYLLLELWSYYRFRSSLGRARNKRFQPQRFQTLAWAESHRSLVTNSSYHCELENRILPVYDRYDLLQPHYKPLCFYTALRSGYYAGSGLMQLCGYRRQLHQGVVFWSKGSCSRSTLFLHGFGFGVLPYYSLLEKLVEQGHRVIAPEFPVICYDGQWEIPSLAEYSRILLSYEPDKIMNVISNSFGSYVHSCLLVLSPERIDQQVFVEPVCFYPYFGTALNFITLRLEDITTRPWNSRMLMQLFTFGLAVKDLSVLRLCQQVKSEMYWDAEQHLTDRTQIILSSEDYIVASKELLYYFEARHPAVLIKIILDCHHGEALFRKPLCFTLKE